MEKSNSNDYSMIIDYIIEFILNLSRLTSNIKYVFFLMMISDHQIFSQVKHP